MHRFSLRAVLAVWAVMGVPARAEAQSPDRTAPPELGPPPSLSLPAIENFKLSNGLPVVLMEKRGVPLVQINVLVGTGAVADGARSPGLASMTAAMLDEGAGARSALELADAIDFLGASLSVSSGRHTTTVALHTPLARLDEALGLLADVTLRPTFSEEEVARQRRSRLTTILQWHDEPRAIASALFDRTLYGEAHPYGQPIFGRAATIRELSADDLRNFHAAHFVANNATIIVVGEVGAEEILPRLEAAFGSWGTGSATQPAVPEAAQVESRQIFLADKPGAAQSEIRIGRIGAPRLTPDYAALVVMNTILGGSFASRLNQNLREDKGYSYGAYSSFQFRPAAGPFLAGAAVQTDVTDKALVEFMNELEGILEPVPEAELDRARNYVALRYPSRFQSVEQVAGQLSQLVEYGLPTSFFADYVRDVLAVSAADISRVARQYLDPARVAIIVVGDRAEIEQGLRVLDLGPLHVLSVEDVLGPPPQVGDQAGDSD